MVEAKPYHMFLQLKHQKIRCFSVFAFVCWRMLQTDKRLTREERYNLIRQIRRAALSVHLNIAEGASGKSLGERKRFYEIPRGSVIEIDAALDVAEDMGYIKKKKWST